MLSFLSDIHWTGKVERVAFTLFGHEVAWYGIIVTFAMFVGLFLAILRSRKANFKADDWLEIFLFAIPIAVLFGRLGYVMVRPDEYFNISPFTLSDFVRIFAVWEGGITILTGIIGGVIGGAIWCLIRKANLLTVADYAMPTILAGQALGRWANFFNQEIYGAAVTNEAFQFFPFSVYITKNNGFYQACFFYEMILNLIMLVVILLVLRHIRLKGSGLLAYISAYSLVRFIMEFFRDDGAVIETTNFVQFIMGVVTVLSVATLIFLCIRQTKKGVQVWYPKGVPDALKFKFERKTPVKRSKKEDPTPPEQQIPTEYSFKTTKPQNPSNNTQAKPIVAETMLKRPRNKSKKKRR
ncbi:MAG: prolipoprotein diacylglyceryl transferase [Christensenellaceae bacterium]|jgi:phosphatidylglycerol:prolipoprotein diacylglycerol transferase|nr:prolipoprotein diacylglyceryl transferase [Christensenellaceae bacterium]